MLPTTLMNPLGRAAIVLVLPLGFEPRVRFRGSSYSARRLYQICPWEESLLLQCLLVLHIPKSPGGCLGMTVWTQQAQIVLTVVLSVSVNVIKMQCKRLIVPQWWTTAFSASVSNSCFYHSPLDRTVVLHGFKRLRLCMGSTLSALIWNDINFQICTSTAEGLIAKTCLLCSFTKTYRTVQCQYKLISIYNNLMSAHCGTPPASIYRG